MDMNRTEGMTRRDLLRASGVMILALPAGSLATQGTALASSAGPAQGTADDWDYIRGPGEIVPTDRTYAGELALRVDYDFTDGYQDGDHVLLLRQVPADLRDWTRYSGLTFAVNGEQAPYAVEIHLQGAGGIAASPRVTLDKAGWHEVYVPFHLFTTRSDDSGFDWSQVTSERLVLRYQGGDVDPHTVYVGGWERTDRAAPGLPDPSSVATETIAVRVNGIELRFVVGSDDQVLYGLGGVSDRGTLLRSAELANLIHPVVYDREGGRHEVFIFQGVDARAGTKAIRCTSPDGETTLQWVFERARERIEGKKFKGVGYRYEVTSSSVPIDQIDERTTWELGGSSVGNTAVLRSSGLATEVSGAPDVALGMLRPRIRFANAAAFEYQAGELGQLLVTYDRAACISARFAKRADQDVFEYIDTYHLPQDLEIATPTKLVLHARGSVEPGVELINAHTAVQDSVHGRFRNQYGFEPPQIVPSVTMARAQPLDDYEANGWLAEAAELGFKMVHLGSEWNSDTENGGPSTATGIPVWTFDIAESVGGNDALRRLTESAGDKGLAVSSWAPAAHMSRNAPIVKDNPSWAAMGPYDAHASTYWSLATIDMNDPEARGNLLAGLTERRAEDGLDGVWVDSLHNHGFEQYDHANPVVAPHVDAMIAHLRDLQDAGFSVYTEGRGPFGTSSSGYLPARVEFYKGHEYRAYETSMYIQSIPANEIDFYRFAANKALVFNVWSGRGLLDFWEELRTDVALRDEVRHANHDYNAVTQYLQKRRLLHDDQGVEWTAGDGAERVIVVFSYQAFDYRLPNTAVEVTDITTEEVVPIDRRVLRTQEKHTYRIK